MSIESLSEQEQFSLVVLVKALVTSDGQVTTSENIEVSNVARSVDPSLFKRAEAIAFNGTEGLRAFLKTVDRQYARDCIYDSLLEIAKADGIQKEESVMLDTIADAWDIVVLGDHGADA